ncbi:MAG: EamA family transporter [Actinobacteria bacterium]|nr:EamA family transporter [Actinomycetota bacterium]MCI0679158.1 EamA family transporter [Actinomycetota bacterium]
MGVFFGGLSSLFYGVADFVGGEASRRAPAQAVVLRAGFVSAPAITVVALVLGGEAAVRDLVLAVAAGTLGAFGLVLLFTGLAKGHAAAVAPASAVFGAVLPVAAAVILGERPSTLAWAGVILAIPSIVLCSWAAEPGDVAFGGLGYGLLAGLGFGGYTTVISRTSEASNLLPLVPARLALVLVVLLMAAAGLWRLGAVRLAPAGMSSLNGILDVGANVTLLLALRFGSLALVGVAASLYPGVTVILARLINREHLRARQVVGLALTLVALGAIAAG